MLWRFSLPPRRQPCGAARAALAGTGVSAFSRGREFEAGRMRRFEKVSVGLLKVSDFQMSNFLWVWLFK